MLKLGEEGLKKHIKTIGLYNSKGKNVIKLSHILVDEYGGKTPEQFEDLIKLPGVGRKTANVFLNCYHGKLTIGVDTHVFRVSNRLGLVNAKNEVETEKQLLKKLPKEYLLHSHHWLILHGRYICKARKPLCEECNVSEFCKSKKKFMKG
jgi:endonuclease-3